jgi:hypothetical protein
MINESDPLDPKKKILDGLTGGIPMQTAGGIGDVASDYNSTIAGQKPLGMPGSPSNPNTGIGGTPDTGLLGGAPAPVEPGPAAPTYSAGANAGKNSGMILGYDTGKLNDTGYTSGKYNAAVRAFSGGLKQDVGVSRGGLDNMVNYVKANGFPNAKTVGNDKIDFGDGAGPIDVIRSDGQIVFQDPRGGGGTGTSPVGGSSVTPSAGGGVGFSGGGVGGLNVPVDSLLGGDALAKIQAALAQLSGPRSNAQALLDALGGQGNG